MKLLEKIEKLEKILPKVTEGPWEVYGVQEYGIRQVERLRIGHNGIICYEGIYPREDADFIIEARNELPFLLSSLRKCIAVLEFYGENGFLEELNNEHI